MEALPTFVSKPFSTVALLAVTYWNNKLFILKS